MVDFCHFATYFSILGCCLALARMYGGISNPLHAYNAILTRGLFAMVNGPLTRAILIFRNSLVFHRSGV